MRQAVGYVTIKILALLIACAAAGCYPHTCTPNDPTCWNCNVPGTQNPACAPPWQPILVEAKHDAGAD